MNVFVRLTEQEAQNGTTKMVSYSKTIKNLDTGHRGKKKCSLEVRIEPGTKNNDVQVLHNHGDLIGEQSGNLILTFKIIKKPKKK